jgi:polysaccharide export outer membrane protein
MPQRDQRLTSPRKAACILGLALLLLTNRSTAQVPTQVAPGQQLPTPKEAQELLRSQPGLVDQLRQKLSESGLTQDQIKARLRAAGYPEDILDSYLPGADTNRVVQPGPRTIDAIRSLGVLSQEEADSLRKPDSLMALSDSMRQLLDSLRLLKADSLRADSLADSLRVLLPGSLKIFGLETFRRTSTSFQPAQAGPVDENYRLGPGDMLVLIVTGDVERVASLEVTREGFVLIPQVGQVYAANLTLGQLRDQLYTRLGRVYSGVKRGPDARTKFQVSLAKLRSIQVYVTGDVIRPGAYQISGAGTVLTALYAAGGPTSNGSFRRVEVRRGGKLVDSVDLYDYLQRGINRTDVRLETGDVVFVPVHGGFAKVAGKVKRPAIYELLPGETLRDAITLAGGFDPTAYQARVTINRVLPPESRGAGGRARVVVSVGADQFVGGDPPAVPMVPGDSVTVFGVAQRVRSFVTVKGNVWVEGQVGFAPGMKLSDAIRLAGGPKPDLYFGQILVTRLREDSSMVQLRSAFADSSGAVTDDLMLQDQDEIRIFAKSTFRPALYVAVVGAVRKAGRVPYREGMTLRDAVLLAGGLTDDAYLEQAEVARLSTDSTSGALATTMRVPLDSTYLFGRRAGDVPGWPPGLPTEKGGAPETPLRPYDNVLIMRQPGWDLLRSVAVAGQVKYPGRYSLLSKTDRVSDVIKRAGGVTAEAYPDGVEFYRNYAGTKPSAVEQLPGVPADAPSREDSTPRSLPERIGIDLAKVLRDPGFRDNIILTGGDSIYVPEFNPVVMVQGAVNSPGAVAYTPGKNLDWYVNAAGGYTQRSDDKHAYVTQPNGARQGVKRKVILVDDVPRPRPGAVVYVPTKLIQEQPSNVLGAVSSVAALIGSLATIILVARTRN